MMRRRHLWSLVTAGFVALSMSACAAGTASGVSSSKWLLRHYLGAPPGVTEVVNGARTGYRDDAIWLAPDEIGVVTWGSSGCPTLPIQIHTPSKTALTLILSSGPPLPSGYACLTNDLATTSVVRVPTYVDDGKRLVVTLIDGVSGATYVLPPWSPPTS
jgi:hypothetical protein